MRWRSFPVVVFDCDSTLSEIEGIDVLAAQLGREQEVADLTNAAMDGEIDLGDVYGRRLELLNPTRRQVRALKEDYKAGVVDDAREVVAALHHVEHETWIVSGGLLEPVMEFGIWLGIEPERIRAVDTDYDPLAGRWWSLASDEARYLDYTSGHLTATTGKGDVIAANTTRSARKIMVGDGMSDAEAGSHVDLFVAYAGVVDRPAVTSTAPVVIRSRSLSPVLALALGPERVRELLAGEHAEVASRCLDAISGGGLAFNDYELGNRFQAALDSGS